MKPAPKAAETAAPTKTAGKKKPASGRALPLGGVSYAAAARALAPACKKEEWTTVQTKKRPTPEQTENPLTPSNTSLSVEKRKVVPETNGPPAKPPDNDRGRKAREVMSAVHQALYQAGVPGFVRLADLAINGRGTMAGMATTICTAEVFLRYKDFILRAELTECQGITDITTKETRKRVKIHGVPLRTYIGRGSFGTENSERRSWARTTDWSSPWPCAGWAVWSSSSSGSGTGRSRHHRSPLRSGETTWRGGF